MLISPVAFILFYFDLFYFNLFYFILFYFILILQNKNTKSKVTYALCSKCYNKFEVKK